MEAAPFTRLRLSPRPSSVHFLSLSFSASRQYRCFVVVRVERCVCCRGNRLPALEEGVRHEFTRIYGTPDSTSNASNASCKGAHEFFNRFAFESCRTLARFENIVVSRRYHDCNQRWIIIVVIHLHSSISYSCICCTLLFHFAWHLYRCFSAILQKLKSLHLQTFGIKRPACVFRD